MLVATGVKVCVQRARAACEGKGEPQTPAHRPGHAVIEKRATCFIYSLAGRK